jgi:aldose 1-epimerase
MDVDGARNKVLMLIVICMVGAGWAANPHESSSEAAVETSKFGSLDDGTAIDLYVLKNAKGSSAKIITYGATLTELWVKDRSGKLGDVVLGFDNLQGYLGKHPWFGATVGRVANRIANGRFTLDGKEYSLEINDPPNSLHSGSKDLSRVVWKAEPVHERNGAAVRFTYDSPEGDEGFPGRLLVTILYRLTDNAMNCSLNTRRRPTKRLPSILPITAISISTATRIS